MNKVVITSMLAAAVIMVPAIAPAAFAQTQAAQQKQITIKDPAEYNAYTNAISQSTPAAKAAAIEGFLKTYPNSVVKKQMLEQLVSAYQAAGDTAKTYSAAERLLQIEPDNLRALTFVVYVEKAQAGSDQAKLDDAAAKARIGLKATKPADMSEADFAKLKSVSTPIFYNAIAADDLAKKDYTAEIADITAELKALPAEATTKQPALADTYYLGDAYVQESPKDLVNAIWFLTRAAQYLPDPYKTNAEKGAKYWYQKYHGSMSGYEQIQELAKANVFPPATYKPTPAPPPPTPAELAHNAVVNTPNLKTLSLNDKEYVLKNGVTADAQAVWAVLNGVVAAVPGTVISATADSVQLAVSDDAKNSQKADFTINMKKPLRHVPVAGTSVTYDATFSSFTQKPFMIIMSDGAVPPPAHSAHHSRRARRK